MESRFRCPPYNWAKEQRKLVVASGHRLRAIEDVAGACGQQALGEQRAEVLGTLPRRPRPGRGSTRCRRGGRRRLDLYRGSPSTRAWTPIGVAQLASSRPRRRARRSARAAPRRRRSARRRRRPASFVGARLEDERALSRGRGHQLGRDRGRRSRPRAPAGAGPRRRARSRPARPRRACAAGCRRCRAARSPAGRGARRAAGRGGAGWRSRPGRPRARRRARTAAPIQASAGSSRAGTAAIVKPSEHLRGAGPWPSGRRSRPRRPSSARSTPRTKRALSPGSPSEDTSTSSAPPSSSAT